jgi:hypothetical protein
MAAGASDSANTTASIENALGIANEEITAGLDRLKELGLIDIISRAPLMIRYNDARNAAPVIKFKKGKYSDFNIHLQQMLPGRMLSQNEFLELYNAMELSGVKPEAMLLIARHCINAKGGNVSAQYIITVAKAWADEGIRTEKEVEKKCEELSLLSFTIKDVYQELNQKTAYDIEDKSYYLKWTKNWGYDHIAVKFAARQCRNKGGFKKLDVLLDSYYRLNIHTVSDMEKYKQRRDMLRNIAIEVNKQLGLYYESLDPVVETYIAPWADKGYDEEALAAIAKHCFVGGKRRLEDMNNLVNKLYKSGRVTKKGITQYIEEAIAQDNFIKEIFAACNQIKNVTGSEREYLTVWKNDWNFGDDVILYAAAQTANRPFPFTNINQLLSNYKNQGAYTLDKVKELAAAPKATAKTSNTYKERDYTKEELDALFTDVAGDII